MYIIHIQASDWNNIVSSIYISRCFSSTYIQWTWICQSIHVMPPKFRTIDTCSRRSFAAWNVTGSRNNKHYPLITPISPNAPSNILLNTISDEDWVVNLFLVILQPRSRSVGRNLKSFCPVQALLFDFCEGNSKRFHQERCNLSWGSRDLRHSKCVCKPREPQLKNCISCSSQLTAWCHKRDV